MPNKVNRSTLLGVRLTEEERAQVDAAALASGSANLSRWARAVLLEHSRDAHQGRPEPCPKPAKARKLATTWAQEWDAMDEMAPTQAMVRLKALIAGRTLPDGFAMRTREERIAWLEANWPR